MAVFLALLSSLFLYANYQRSYPWRQALLLAALIWGSLLTFGIEGLSLLRALSFWPLTLFWFLIDISLLLAIWWRYRAVGWHWFAGWRSARGHLRASLSWTALLVGIVLICLITGVIALVAPPNTWDAMTYHLPRVAHWQQNHSVAHYPTNFLPQLYYSPWSEYAILNFKILWGSDRLANLVQWLSMVGCLVGVSAIAQQLGANTFGQILAAVFVATLPMGILQASSSKNDYTVAFWLVCLAFFVLLAIRNPQNEQRYAVWVGISLGLALLTKGTGYPYSLPFYIWYLIALLWRNRHHFIRGFLLTGSTALIVNIGFYRRNLELFGRPIFAHPDYQTEIDHPLLYLSHVTKNLALHLPIPGIENSSQFFERSIRLLHQLIGVNINDPRVTSPGLLFTLPRVFTFEDTAPNPFHFYLLIFAIALTILYRALRRNQLLCGYLLCVTGSFAIFCWLAKWQPWQSRLHLAIFILLGAAYGVIMSQTIGERFNIYIALLLIGFASFWLFYNDSRPLLTRDSILSTPRIEQYFAIRNDLKPAYLAIAREIEQLSCRQVGVYLPGDYWEYPLWTLLPSSQIRHVRVRNVSRRTWLSVVPDTFVPCSIISISPQHQPVLQTEFGVYQQYWTSRNLPVQPIGDAIQLYTPSVVE